MGVLGSQGGVGGGPKYAPPGPVISHLCSDHSDHPGILSPPTPSKLVLSQVSLMDVPTQFSVLHVLPPL